MSVKDGLINRTEKPRKYTEKELVEMTLLRVREISSGLLWLRFDVKDIMDALGISKKKAKKGTKNTNTQGLVWDQNTPDKKEEGKKDPDKVWSV